MSELDREGWMEMEEDCQLLCQILALCVGAVFIDFWGVGERMQKSMPSTAVGSCE